MGEHLLCTQGVAGSIPVASTPRVGGLIRGLLLLSFCACATGKERTGLVLADDQRVLLVDDQGAKVRLQLVGEARAIENLLGCRVKKRHLHLVTRIELARHEKARVKICHEGRWRCVELYGHNSTLG